MKMLGQALVFAACAAVAGLLCWFMQGEAAVEAGARNAIDITVSILPQLVLGLTIAGFAQVLLPRDKVAGLLGARSGMRGLWLAAGFGALIPGGPFASFPIVHALARSGADMGAVMAFLVSWSTIGLHRLLVWDVPILGLDFSLLRMAASLPLPILAGLLARHLAARHALFRPYEAP
jgi:uncharacterized membrane protein YraQ (UPF0718 family)